MFIYFNVFLFYIAAKFLVSANPFLQELPIQSCACQNYPQNYQNFPFALPTQSNVQQYMQFSNIDPYSQDNLVQNQAPYQSQSQQEQINQLMLNKVLENPMLRRILDPNTKLYNQNGCEIQRNPVVQNLVQHPIQNAAQNSVPNVVNNYIIIPPDLLLDPCQQEINGNNNGRSKKISEGSKRNQGGERRDVTKQRRQDYQLAKTQNTNKNVEDREIKRKAATRRGRRGERRNKKNNKINVNKTMKENDGNNYNLHLSSSEYINKNISNKSPMENLNTQPNATTLVPNNDSDIFLDESIPNSKDAQNSYDRSAKLKEANQECNENIKSIPKSQLKNKNIEAQLKKKRVNNSVREESVIQDFKTKFPGIPENLVRDLMAHMKRQLQNEGLTAPNYFYPNYPITYDQLYRNPFNNLPNFNNFLSTGSKIKQNSKGKSNRRNRNKKRKDHKIRENPQNPLLNGNQLELTTTTEKATIPSLRSTLLTMDKNTEKQKIAENTESTTISDQNKVHEKIEEKSDTKKAVMETTTTYIIPLKGKIYEEITEVLPKLGKEETVPIFLVNDLPDDYYPDFTDNKANWVSSEEYDLTNLQGDRYYYTTDRNFDIVDSNKTEQNDPKEKSKFSPRKSERIIQNKRNRFHVTIVGLEDPRSRIKTYEEVETTLPRPDETETEEIHYRTPPTLEIPDFKTSKINKAFKSDIDGVYYYPPKDEEPKIKEKFKEVLDKTSTFSDVKTSQYDYQKAAEVKKKAESNGKIETVYARSKVAKYGTPVFDEDTELKENEESLNISDLDNPEIHYPAIVTAKSYPEDYWY